MKIEFFLNGPNKLKWFNDVFAGYVSAEEADNALDDAKWERLNADEREMFDRVLSSAARMGSLISALLALAREKGFGTWAREFRPIYGPFEAGLGRFVALGKGEFIGRDAAFYEHTKGPQRQRVGFVVDAGDADAIGDEAVWRDGAVVGWITSGGYPLVVYAPYDLPSTWHLTLKAFDTAERLRTPVILLTSKSLVMTISSSVGVVTRKLSLLAVLASMALLLFLQFLPLLSPCFIRQ